MAQFRNENDFYGTYEGAHDGRRARLEIAGTKEDPWWPLFYVTFEDLDRGERYRGRHEQRERPRDGAHVLTDVRLEEIDGSRTVTYRKLLVHTWNTEYLTGISLWNGREFGASYRRTD
jgi:hypothetical protein